MFNPIDWLNSFTAWLSVQLIAILNTLNPVYVIMNALVWIAAMLPQANTDIDTFTNGFQSALAAIGPYFSMIDYIVNLQVWLIAIAIVASVETAVGVFRLWRMVRSAVI